MKTDNVERKLQKYHKRYMRAIEGIILKAEAIDGCEYPVENIASKTRSENISKASRTVRTNIPYDPDLAIVDTVFERILKIVEGCRIYENNNLARVKGRENLYQYGRIGVYRALNKYDARRGVRLITFINRCVLFELSHSKPKISKETFCVSGLTDRDILRYWKMLKAYDDICTGSRSSFNEMYHKNDRLNEFKRNRTTPSDGFCWNDFFRLEDCAVWNVKDVYELDNL